MYNYTKTNRITVKTVTIEQTVSRSSNPWMQLNDQEIHPVECGARRLLGQYIDVMA